MYQLAPRSKFKGDAIDQNIFGTSVQWGTKLSYEQFLELVNQDLDFRSKLEVSGCIYDNEKFPFENIYPGYLLEQGENNFFGLPDLKIKREKEMSESAIIVGADFQQGSVSHSYMIDNVNLLRKTSAQMEMSLQRSSPIWDIGNMLITNNPFLNQIWIRRLVRMLYDFKQKVVIIGGDHSLTYGAVNGVLESGGNLDYVLQIDAHQDKGITRFGLIEHGSVMSEIRNDLNMEVIWINKNSENILSNVKKGAKIYLSIDIDAIDAIYLSSIDYPETPGFTLDELREIIDEIFNKFEVIGVDIVEFKQQQMAPLSDAVLVDSLIGKVCERM